MKNVEYALFSHIQTTFLQSACTRWKEPVQEPMWGENNNQTHLFKPIITMKAVSEKQPSVGTPSCGNLSDRLLNALQTSVIFFDAEGTIIRTNKQAGEDLHAEKTLAGRNLSEMLSVVYSHRDILPEIIAGMNDAGMFQVKLPAGAFVRCNDTKVQFFVSGNITLLECGSMMFSFRNTMDEITREQILSMVLARTRIFPWFYDLDRDRMLIDAHWFSYLGLPEGDCTISQGEFFARVHPDDREMLAQALQAQLTDHEIHDSFDYRLQRGDGTWEWFSEQSMYLSRTDDGSPYRIVGVCHSIQHYKTTEDRLRAARNKAQESDRLKSAFLANMSHEIRTPLNAIVGFSNLLTEEGADFSREEAREYADLIRRNCEHLILLVSDIIDISRIETGTMEYCFAEQPLNQLLSEIHGSHAARVPEGVAFNLLLPSEDVMIETDAQRLRQALGNLLDNAEKFTSRGHIDIGYTLSKNCEYVELFVSDTGCGIQADLQEKIFERFYKVDTFVRGTGLGLSLCRTLVEQLGGTLTVSSRPKEGSQFTLRLPILHKNKITNP